MILFLPLAAANSGPIVQGPLFYSSSIHHLFSVLSSQCLCYLLVSQCSTFQHLLFFLLHQQLPQASFPDWIQGPGFAASH